MHLRPSVLTFAGVPGADPAAGAVLRLRRLLLHLRLRLCAPLLRLGIRLPNAGAGASFAAHNIGFTKKSTPK